MFSNFFKITFRNLARHKLSTFINMFGLSIGIACCVLIMLFVIDEVSFDTFNENADSVYRVIDASKSVNGEIGYDAYMPMPLIPALKADYPEIAHAARFSTGGAIISFGDKSFTERIMFTDPDVFRMFTIRFLAGNRETVLRDPSEIVLTREMALKYFGDENPLGKQLRIRTYAGEGDFVVAGVTEPMPGNSSLKFDFLANIMKHSMYERAKDRWTSANGSAYVRLSRGARPEELEKKLPVFVQKYFAEIIQHRQDEGYLAKESGAYQIQLQPLLELHLNADVESSPEREGDPAYSFILAGIGILVLTIACINFVTLAIGRSAHRAKEVGMRKVLGAVRPQLISQFWGEAFLLCGSALLTGLVLAELMLPTFNRLSDKHLSLDLFSNGGLIAGLAGLLIIVGAAAGSYPALYLSKFTPTETLKGQFKLSGKNLFTRILIVFQFGLSIFLVCGALVLSRQIDYLITRNLGFNPEQVIVLPLNAGKPENAQLLVDRFRTRVLENPNIMNVSVTNGAFTHGYDVNSFKYKGENKGTYVYRVDEEYLLTLGIPLKYGRNFVKGSPNDRDRGMIVNESFLKMMGWPEPGVGNSLAGIDSKTFERFEVIGVVNDFNFTSLHDEIKPAMMFMNPEWGLGELLIRIAPKNMPATMEYLRQVWHDVAPNNPFNATFLDEDFQKQYDLEMRWSRIVTFGSTIALTLACLGLFGLATLAVASRTKEIGIRKVLGASGPGVVKLISKDFLKLVVAANVLAWPLAYLAASSYLENYAYRISLTPLIFMSAGLGVLLIAFLAIAGQVIKAVRANPVESLRYE